MYIEGLKMTVTLTSKAKSHLIFCFMHQKYLKRLFNYNQIRSLFYESKTAPSWLQKE